MATGGVGLLRGVRMSGPTTFVMPTAREELNAEEAKLRGDWRALAEMVEAQADALIAIAVRNGPRRFFSDGSADWDPAADDTAMFYPYGAPAMSAADYCAAARELGVL